LFLNLFVFLFLGIASNGQPLEKEFIEQMELLRKRKFRGMDGNIGRVNDSQGTG
jgi:hypothetical protein